MADHAALNIDLRQMILAIETAVSLVGMNDTNHGKRVGFIASQVAHQAGMPEAESQFAFELGLLHDCGVSTEQMHSSLVNHFDWNDAHIHCEIGYRLLRDFEPLAAFAMPILHHHTPWLRLRGLEVAARDRRMANLIFLSDRVDVMAASHYGADILLAKRQIVDYIQRQSDVYFDPALIDAFRTVERSEAFWIALEARHITRYTWDMGLRENSRPLSLAEIRQLSMILAYIVDQKSPFTAQHSILVADVARYMAEHHGLSTEQCEKVEIAALLHDLGKLHVPDHILDKPGPLNETERSIMNQHSFETYEILRHINGLGELARWAAYHHEGLNGAGYPFHPAKRDLSVEARIIAVADVFQALVQDRPYRKGMMRDEVLDVLRGQAERGRLDRDLVDLAVARADTCYAIARGDSAEHNRPALDLFASKADAAEQLASLVAG
ncbi:HD-GYP domain-containing protein [Nitrogeniibacter aestuarii]|uniref:HD-GYP domain-containing protein n=1 Tax=Nitrogeniibacter aestuarii TaxID=2815343 RepID=UPI001D1030C0|nr:HD domain-containing phosphohydrolase [Nitrogeniibacter aestuarii]